MNKFIKSCLAAFYLLPLVVEAQTSWRGTTSTAWRTAANWTAGVPTASTDAIIGDASFTGAFQPSITANSACKSLTIGTGAKASVLSVSKGLTVSGSIMIGTNGTLTHSGNSTISLTGDWSNFGTYNATQIKATITFSGTSQSLSGATTFRRLTINAGSTTLLAANISVVNQLTVSGTLNPGESPTFAISGNGKLVVNSGGIIMVKASTFAGNYGLSGTFTFNAASSVDYAATNVNQTVSSALTYGTLRISGGGTKTLAGNLPALNSTAAATGNIIVAAGTLDLGAFTANRGTTTTGGTLSVANGATLKIGGANSFPANYATHSLGIASTVEYSGTNQTVSRESYGNLTLSSSGGAATKTMPISAMTVAGNLTASVGTGTSVSFTAGAAITINGSVSIGAGTTFNGSSFAHSVGANWTNNGTFSGSTGSLSLNGAGASIAGAGTNNFNNLTIAGAGITAASNTALNVAGNFSATGAGTFTHLAGGTGTLTMSGAGKTISGASIALNNLTVSGSVSTVNSLTVAGNLTVNGSFSATAGTVTLSGAAKTMGGTGTITLFGLNVPGSLATARNLSIASDLSVPGSLTASAGTVTFAGSSTLSGSPNLFNVTLNGTRLQLGSSSVLGIAGTFAISAGTFDVATSTPNTVNYNGPGAQTILAATYDNLSLSGSGVKTAGGALTINRDLVINSGATFGAGSFSHALSGNWINNGAFTAGTSTIRLLGTLDAAISGATTFNTLTVNKSAANNVVALSNNVGVATLNMTTGSLNTGTNAVTITTDRTGGGIILGTITRTHAFATATPYAFEGTNNTITFTTASGVTSVTVAVQLGIVLDFPFGGAINRQYAVSVAAGGPYSADLRLHYEDPELNGNNESQMKLWHFGGPWTDIGKTNNDAVNNWVELTGLTDITGRWTLSDDAHVVRWNGTISSAWETAGNWTAVAGTPSLPPSTNDIVQIAVDPFVNQPRISTPVSVRLLSFGSAQVATLTLSAGGPLILSGNFGNVSGTWTNNVTHTINVGDQSLIVGAILLLSDGTDGHAIDLSVGVGSVVVRDGLTESGGANISFSGAGSLTIGGDFNYASGAFTPGASTVTYNGSAGQIVAGGITYHHLSLNKPSGVATLPASAAVNGDLTLSTGGTFSMTAPLAVGGNVVIGAGTTFDGDGSTISVGGNWTVAGTFVSGTGTVLFNGSGSQAIAAATFNNLTVSKSSGTAILTGNLTMNGDLSVAAGALDLSIFTANRSTLGGTLSLGAGSTLHIGNGSGFPSGFGSRILAASSTVHYQGTAPQSVAPEAYGNLLLSNGGANAKSLSGVTTVAGDVVVDSGTTFDAGPFTLAVQGNWTNNGAFTPSASSVTLAGASKNLSGSTTFSNLTISGSYTAASDVTVNGTMSVTGTYSAGGTTATFAGDFDNTGTFTSSGNVTFTGTGGQTIGLNSGFSSSGTVNFNGTITPTFSDLTSPLLQNVNINNSSGIAPSTDWTINGAFVVGSGSTFTGGAATHTFNGAFTNNGTVSSSGTLLFNPATAETLVLSGSSFSSSGTVTFGGTGLITVAGGVPSFNSVVVVNTDPAGVTPASNWTLTGDLFVGVGATLNGGSGLTHTVSGNWAVNGTFNGGTSSVILNGTTDIAGNGSSTFNHLTVTGVVTAMTDFNVSGNFTNNNIFDGTGVDVAFTGSSPSIIAGSTTPTPFDSLTIAKNAAAATLALNLNALTALTIASGTLDISSFTVAQDPAGGSLSINAGGTLRIGGANTLPVFNTYSFDPASTVEYAGTGIQNIAAQNYGNLTSSSTGARILPPAGTVGIAGTFAPGANTYTITGNTIDFNGSGAQTIPAFNYNNLTSSSTGARTLAPAGTIGIAATFTPGANTYTTTGSTINFRGAAQTVPAFAYHNLTTSGSGTKTLAGDITVNGALTLSAGALADGGFTATVKGNIANDVTHTGTGRMFLNGGTVQHLLSGIGSYQNLELNDANGALLNTNLTVNGTLILTSGTITTTTNKVVISASGNVARTSGYVVGNLQKSVPIGSTITNSFEIGDGASYSPATVLFTNVTSAGNLTARVTTGDHPDIANSGVAATRSVNRYWTITNSSVVFGNYGATFNFVPGDLDAGATPTNFVVAKLNGTNWTLPLIGARSATNIQAVGMTNMSDFVVGEPVPVAPTIVAQPQSLRVNTGGNATFGVTANGTGTLTYQWRFNGFNLAGETNLTLVITNVQDVNAGSYSVAVDDGAVTISSNALLTVNHPPALTSIANQTVNEQTLFTIATSVTDADGGTRTYTLTAAPSGAAIDSSGVITWTPTEAQGPSTNTISVQVSDDGVPPLSATQSFTIIVNEVNTAPSLTVPATQTINELTTLTVTNTASDGDLPAQTLTFALVSAPTGVNLNAATGVLTWTPTESQGPSTNLITLRLSDNGSPSLSATQSFTIIVNEVNTAPGLAPIADRTNFAGSTIIITNVATDADIPTNALTFSLGSNAPAGAAINGQTGVFTWTLPAPNGSTNLVTIIVTDNGAPTMTATRTFTIVGLAVTVPTIRSIQMTNGNSLLGVSGTAGQNYRIEAATNLNNPINWTSIATNAVGTNGLAQFEDLQTANFPIRFYRLAAP